MKCLGSAWCFSECSRTGASIFLSLGIGRKNQMKGNRAAPLASEEAHQWLLASTASVSGIVPEKDSGGGVRSEDRASR